MVCACTGKDSIRYENTVEVDERVFKNVEKFKRVDQHGKKKQPGDQLFGAWLRFVPAGCIGGLCVCVSSAFSL